MCKPVCNVCYDYEKVLTLQVTREAANHYTNFMMHFYLLQRQNVCMVNVWFMWGKKKKVKRFLPTVICGGTQHTTIEIALYIHTPTDTHTSN